MSKQSDVEFKPNRPVDDDTLSQFQQDSEARDRMAGESPALANQVRSDRKSDEIVGKGFRSISPAVAIGLFGISFLTYFTFKRWKAT